MKKLIIMIIVSVFTAYGFSFSINSKTALDINFLNSNNELKRNVSFSEGLTVKFDNMNLFVSGYYNYTFAYLHNIHEYDAETTGLDKGSGGKIVFGYFHDIPILNNSSIELAPAVNVFYNGFDYLGDYNYLISCGLSFDASLVKYFYNSYISFGIVPYYNFITIYNGSFSPVAFGASPYISIGCIF